MNFEMAWQMNIEMAWQGASKPRTFVSLSQHPMLGGMPRGLVRRDPNLRHDTTRRHMQEKETTGDHRSRAEETHKYPVIRQEVYRAGSRRPMEALSRRGDEWWRGTSRIQSRSDRMGRRRAEQQEDGAPRSDGYWFKERATA